MGDLQVRLKYIDQEIQRIKVEKEQAIRYANNRMVGLTEEKYKLLKLINEEEEKNNRPKGK